MSQSQTKEKTRTDTAFPKMYNVIIYNNDYTSMTFVITLLMEKFNKDANTANKITMDIHQTGAGIAGTYTKEVAETKTAEALYLCQLEKQQLKIEAKPAV